MRRWGQIIGFLALLVFLMPMLAAQEEKKDADKAAEKKDPDKKGAEKKDPDKKAAEKKGAEKKDPDKKGDPETKDDEKKSEKKGRPEKKEIERVEYGVRLPPTKLVRIADNSAREFAIEVPEIDPEKVYNLKVWQFQQMQQIAQQQDPRQRYNQMMQYQVQLAQKQNSEIYKMVQKELRAADNIKVRTMFLPIQFDDTGNPKKWTTRSAAAFRGKTTLPGYPAELDALKVGQIVQCYLAKTHKTKTSAVKRKTGDDELPDAETRPEAVMIVVLQEAPRQ